MMYIASMCPKEMFPEEYTIDEGPDVHWLAKITFLNGPDEGRSIIMDGDLFTIGRSFICNLQIDNNKVSRQHAEIVFEDGRSLF